VAKGSWGAFRTGCKEGNLYLITFGNSGV
jgi:hypothetical protein